MQAAQWTPPTGRDMWVRRKRKIPKYLREFRPNPEFLAEQAKYPRASPEVSQVSGVGVVAPSAIGKVHCALLADMFRPTTLPMKTLVAMNKLVHAPASTQIYQEKNGQGVVYYRAKARLPATADNRSRWFSVYLGRDPRIAQWAREILTEKQWLQSCKETPPRDLKHVDDLYSLRRLVQDHAVAMASRAGFGFRGARLLRSQCHDH